MRNTDMDIRETRSAAPPFATRPATRMRARIVAALGLAMTACGDSPVVPDGTITLAVVSGDRQSGKAGHDLPDPFLVRVTDGHGRGMEHVAVTWTVQTGEGALDGRFDMPGCPPLGTARVHTDVDGFARVSFMPTWFGPSTVAASVPGARGSPGTFTTDASDPGAAVTIVDGDNQQGKTTEPLPKPMRVRVTGGDGRGVPNVSVSWVTHPDRGTLLDGCPWTTSWNQSITTVRTGLAFDGDGADSTGIASLRFRPGESGVGPTTVSVAVPGLSSSPATFTVETSTVVIALIHDGWLNTIHFRGSRRYEVPVGTPVEFRNDVPESQLAFVRIVSTSTPPGGAAFDSGQLSPGGRFAFVPRVTGTWLFIDEASGAMGELAVH